MWYVIISIVIFNTLHLFNTASLNYRPVIWMTDLQKSNVVRNGPESRPMQFKSQKPICGPLPFPNFSCEQRQPSQACNASSMHGVLHKNQDPNCNVPRAQPVPIYRVTPYQKDYLQRVPPPPLRANPMREYQAPLQHQPQLQQQQLQQQQLQQQQQHQQHQAQAQTPPQAQGPPQSQHLLRGYGGGNWQYQNRPQQQRYVPGRTTSYRPMVYQSRGVSRYPDRDPRHNRDAPHLGNYPYHKLQGLSLGGITSSTLVPDTPEAQTDETEKDKEKTRKNRWGTTSTQAPFPGGITPSLDTPAQNKCGEYAVCYQPTWTERTQETKPSLKLHYHEEMDPDLMKYILPRH